MKQYRNINTDETVYEDEAQDYVLEKLGLIIKPLGNNGTLTIDQQEFISEFTEWYFSGNWVKERVQDEDIPDLEYDLEMADKIYQDKLDREWGLY